jgi:ketosteroid isomerase-like protein
VSSNSELLLAGYGAWNRGDLEAYLELLHPNVHISTSGVFPDLAREYSGRKRAATFWRQMHEPWEHFRIDVEHIEDEADWAIASLRFRARGAGSGVEVDMRFGMAIPRSAPGSPTGPSPTSTRPASAGCRSTTRRTSATRSRGSARSCSRTTPRAIARASGC